MLKIEGNFPCLRARSAQFVGHLPVAGQTELRLACSLCFCYTHSCVGMLGITFVVYKESMPKPPAHALTWSAENHGYILHTPDHPPQPIQSRDEEAWQAWLSAHSSFPFQGPTCTTLQVSSALRTAQTDKTDFSNLTQPENEPLLPTVVTRLSLPCLSLIHI